MSHSSKFGSTTFIHNGDYSGPITIVGVDKRFADNTSVQIEVPMEDISAFFRQVMEDMIQKKIAELGPMGMHALYVYLCGQGFMGEAITRQLLDGKKTF